MQAQAHAGGEAQVVQHRSVDEAIDADLVQPVGAPGVGAEVRQLGAARRTVSSTISQPIPAMICRPQAWNSPGKFTAAVTVVPPRMPFFSTSAVRAPARAAWIAATTPAGPPPTTTTS